MKKTNNIITLNNLWENRETVIEDCKQNKACKEQFKRLVRARSSKTFKKVILDNFSWVNKNINICPKFDFAYDFSEYDIAVIRLNDKYGVIKSDGSYLIEPKFDFANNFDAKYGIDIARVLLNGKYGYINSDGTYLIKPIFDDAWHFTASGSAEVKLNGKWGKIDLNGNFI